MMQEDISYLTSIKYHFAYMYMSTWREFLSVIGGLWAQSTGGRRSLSDPWGTNFFSNSELS